MAETKPSRAAPTGGDDAVSAFQARLNRSTRGHWDWFASHRRQLETLLLPPGVARGGGRLCVLGAGNCNDLHLPTLADTFGEVHLVDIDAAAIEGAVRRQGVECSPAVRLHGGVDLTGVADVLSSWRAARPDLAAIDACLQWLSAPPPADFLGGAAFDVVLSPCVLSQLIRSVAGAVGDGHPRFPQLLVALRRRHLWTLAGLLAPGGTAILACDLVSTETLPELRRADELALQGLMDKSLNDRNFFTGLSPSAVEGALRDDPHLAGKVERVTRTRPWLWHLGPRRAYLVYALHFRRADTHRSIEIVTP